MRRELIGAHWVIGVCVVWLFRPGWGPQDQHLAVPRCLCLDVHVYVLMRMLNVLSCALCVIGGGGRLPVVFVLVCVR